MSAVSRRLLSPLSIGGYFCPKTSARAVGKCRATHQVLFAQALGDICFGAAPDVHRRANVGQLHSRTLDCRPSGCSRTPRVRRGAIQPEATTAPSLVLERTPAALARLDRATTTPALLAVLPEASGRTRCR